VAGHAAGNHRVARRAPLTAATFRSWRGSRSGAARVPERAPGCRGS